MAPRLSENSVGRDCIGTRSYDNIDFTHCSSAATTTMARYLVSMEERATVRCFVELREIGLALRKMRKAPIDVRSCQLPAQSASEKPCKV